MIVLGLVKYGDLIVEYNDGENSDLFNFGKPENAALGQPNSLIIGGLTSGQYMPLHQQRKV